MWKWDLQIDVTRGSFFLPLFLSLHKEPLELRRVGKTCICMNIDLHIIINLDEETLVGDPVGFS